MQTAVAFVVDRMHRISDASGITERYDHGMLCTMAVCTLYAGKTFVRVRMKLDSGSG